MLKCDFHLHSSEDPHDVLDYDAFELVNHAAHLKFQVLAITLHGRLYCPEDLQEYARSRGILLIPGIEVYLDGGEVLLLGNCIDHLPHLKKFDDLLAFKKACREDLLVIAPHPFYMLSQCIGRRLEEYPDVFDAIEFCHLYTSWWNPNLRAEAVAQRIRKPMIACSDTHQLKWMGHHYTLLDAEPHVADVFAAIRAGRVQSVSRPLENIEFFGKALWHLTIADLRKFARRWGFMQRHAPYL